MSIVKLNYRTAQKIVVEMFWFD